MGCCSQICTSNLQTQGPTYTLVHAIRTMCSVELYTHNVLVSDELSYLMKFRIADLCKAFVSCGYPKSLVQRISNKVLNVKRDLSTLIRNRVNDTPTHPNDNVRIVSTFGTDASLVQCVKQAIPHLQNTNSCKSRNVSFKFVKKTAPNMGSKLAVLRKMSLNIGPGGTSKCSISPRYNCQCCDVVPTTPISKVTVNGQKVCLPKGNCKSKNIIYLAQCNLCNDKSYVGRTVQPLHKRVTGHRTSFANVVRKGLNQANSLDTEDTYSLGIHLNSEHGITSEFNKYYTFHVLEYVSPLQMEKSEHL